MVGGSRRSVTIGVRLALMDFGCRHGSVISTVRSRAFTARLSLAVRYKPLRNRLGAVIAVVTMNDGRR